MLDKSLKVICQWYQVTLLQVTYNTSNTTVNYITSNMIKRR